VNNFKKITIICFIALLTSCGFKPLLSNKESSFTIKKIDYSGEERLNYLIINKLETYKNLKNKDISYKLNINTISNKLVTSKDTKGNSKTFRYEISSVLIINQNNKPVINKTIKKNFSYNNLSNKFELKKYEEKIMKNLTNEVFLDILNILRSI
jgi:hypothetical protein